MKCNFVRVKEDFAPIGIYEFSKTVKLEKKESYKINIYTTGIYVLKINGRYVCEGPCKGSEDIRYFDAVTTDAFVKGDNEIKIVVMHIPENSMFTTMYKTLIPEFIFEAVSENNVITSDDDWKCVKDNSFSLRDVRWHSTVPYEDVDFRKGKENFEVECKGAFDFAKGLETFCGMIRGQELTQRPIPMIFPGEETEFKVIKSGDDFVELDAGKYMTAKVYFELKENSDVKIIYAERYKKEIDDGVCDDSKGEIEGYFDTVKTKENTCYSPFSFRSFRFIRVEAENVNDVLLSVKARRWQYPLSFDGKFVCSDDSFNQMYAVSENTLLCCTHDTFYDCPYYEQRQYEMDSAVEAMVWMRMTKDTKIIKKCLFEFGASQQPSGLLLSIYPSSVKQIITGYSFYWIFMLYDYAEYTKDYETANKLIGNIDKIFTYFKMNSSPKGLITKGVYWDFVDWVPQWDNGEPVTKAGNTLTVYSMYFAYALLCASKLCEKTGRKALAEEYKEEYIKVKQAIKKYCYDEKKGMYSDSADESKFSTHTIIWAILAEIETGEDALKLIEHLKDDDIAKSSFAMNFYLFRALEKCGLTDKIFENLTGWHEMLKMHCTTWRERPNADVRSECHGWSSAPLYEFSSNVLGVKVGFEDEIVIKPYLAGLKFAKGDVPTRFGTVNVTWTNDENGFCINVKAPLGVPKKIVLPDGKTAEFSEKETAIEVKSI